MLHACRRICVGFVIILMAQNLAAESIKHSILIAAEDSWPPFSDKQGEGISKRIATAAFAVSGIKIQTRVLPYARALRETQAGSVDACWNVTRQPNTESQFHFGDEPLLLADISFYYHSSAVQTYRRFADIPNNTKLGVILGYEYGTEFEKHKHRFNLIEVSTQASLLKMLALKRVDIALLFDKVYEATIQKENLIATDYVKGDVFYTSHIYIAFNKFAKYSNQLSQALDRGLRTLKTTGEYDKLLTH